MRFQVGANAHQIIGHTFGDYHDSVEAFQKGTIAFKSNPELSTQSADALARIGDVIRLTVNDSVFEVTVTAANNGSTEMAAAFATLIEADGEVEQLVSASAATGTLTKESLVAGTAFTVSTNLNSDQSMLDYVETTANATRGWELLKPLHITNQTNSTLAIDALDHGIQTVNQGRADIGATISRLTSAIDNMTTASTNLSDSRSRIMDADYAVESTNLAKAMIVSQAATAMLAQANAQPQSVLALLQ
jgi:flagellin